VGGGGGWWGVGVGGGGGGGGGWGFGGGGGGGGGGGVGGGGGGGGVVFIKLLLKRIPSTTQRSRNKGGTVRGCRQEKKASKPNSKKDRGERY